MDVWHVCGGVKQKWLSDWRESRWRFCGSFLSCTTPVTILQVYDEMFFLLRKIGVRVAHWRALIMGEAHSSPASCFGWETTRCQCLRPFSMEVDHAEDPLQSPPGWEHWSFVGGSGLGACLRLSVHSAAHTARVFRTAGSSPAVPRPPCSVASLVGSLESSARTGRGRAGQGD